MKILLTTDFTEASYHAIDYIKSLTKNWSSDSTSFVIVHGYQTLAPYPMTTDSVEPQNPAVPVIEDQELQKQLRAKFDELAEELKQHINLTAQYFEIGTLSLVIEDLMEKESPDLIVMGTREKNAFERMAVGTNTIEVVSKTSVPVLAVPKEASTKPISNLSFGLDVTTDEWPTRSLDFLKRWTTLNGSSLEVVSVADKGSEKQIKERMKNTAVHQQLIDLDHDHKAIVHKDVYEGITSYVNEKQPDVLAIVAGERSFWDRIFHQTKTEKLAHHLQIPVLLL